MCLVLVLRGYPGVFAYYRLDTTSDVHALNQIAILFYITFYFLPVSLNS